jgi:membrane-bound metal-dependent hydrolase YbcI (DUF457 family)
MDLLSHALLGSLVASVGLQRKYGLVASATMVAANLIPDLDGAATVLGPGYFLQYHRHPLTHSVGGAVLLSAVIAAGINLFTPFKRPGLAFGIAFGGILLHLLSDLLTPWPIPLLWPITSRTYSLDLINFLDPFLLVLLLVSFFATRHWPENGLAVSALALLVASGYLGFRYYGQQVAINQVKELSPTGKLAALPHNLSLVAWDVIEKNGTDYTYSVVDALSKEIRDSQVIQSSGDRQILEISKKSGVVQAFLKRARFPFALVSKEGNKITVEWRDVHLLFTGGALRGVKVVLDGEGNIVDEKFELRSR